MLDSESTELGSATEIYFVASWSHYFIIACAVASILWGIVNVILIRQIDITKPEPIQKMLEEEARANGSLQDEEGADNADYAAQAKESSDLLVSINKLISDGANNFLYQEYTYLLLFCAVFAIIIGFTVDYTEMNEKRKFRPASNFPYTAVSFLVGALTSILAGWIGMQIATYTNARTTYQCCLGEFEDQNIPDEKPDASYLDMLVLFHNIKNKDSREAPDRKDSGETKTEKVKDLSQGFMAAFQGGQVLGFCLVGVALLFLEIIILVYKAVWFDKNLDAVIKLAGDDGKDKSEVVSDLVRRLFEFVAGYGLGGSTVALFGRVGGGIYTKAADVGADLVGKVVAGLEEDSPENPGTIADNVGDNVGDIAGMGADLFGSLAESTCAALVVSSTSIQLIEQPDALFFPLLITSVGIIASAISVLFARSFTITVYTVQSVLKAQLLISTAIMSILLVPLMFVLPTEFTFVRKTAEGQPNKGDINTGRWYAYGCIMFGLWSGMIIGYVTEYYTSNVWSPTLRLYRSCRQGAAPNIIHGLALGYASCVVPIFCITATIAFSFATSGMYGIGLAALGMLGSLPVALTIDGYGPISDNAGGLAEMSGLPKSVRDRTDALDAAGNTTAAIGKGFAIGSACLVGLALFGAFVTRIEESSVDILEPIQFSGLLVGAMLPYWFSSMTMVAVGEAAEEMMGTIMADMEKVRKLRAEEPDKTHPIDYKNCIDVSTRASLKYMILPGVLVIGAPLLAGILFGEYCVEGILAGSIVSGVQVAISASNTGGAWDNAKKEVERQRRIFYQWCEENWEDFAQAEDKKDFVKGAIRQYNDLGDDLDLDGNDEHKKLFLMAAFKEQHTGAVVGDTVGDPLKDTSGPAINILIKLSAITSLVFGSFIKNAGYITNLFKEKK